MNAASFSNQLSPISCRSCQRTAFRSDQPAARWSLAADRFLRAADCWTLRKL